MRDSGLLSLLNSELDADSSGRFTALLRERDGSDASPEWMPLTSGQSGIQTTLKTFQDLDLSTKAVIMDVVRYIGRQQLRNKQAL